jgi:Core-2/I-Branching enzyme
MRIANLILAHKNPSQLERLLKALAHPAFAFYIHVDKKADQTPFLYLQEIENVFFIQKRTPVYWAGYGTIQATLNGFEEIVPHNYDYINVISAQDFPLKSPQEIYDFIYDQKGAEFITCESIDDEWKEAAPRVHEYHFINWNIPGKFKLGKMLTKLLPKRKFPLPYKIVGRANWFTITNDASAYILEFLVKHPQVTRYFRYCWGADEFIFSTILYNSRFKPSIKNNMVYVDWTGQTQGHPRILNSSDFDKLKASDKLFARKFDMQLYPEIFDLLESLIKKKPET